MKVVKKTRATRWPNCCGQAMTAKQDSLELHCQKCGLVVVFKSQPR